MINAQGEYSVNNKALANNQLDTLRRAIKAVASRPRDLQVIIYDDAVAPHQSVVSAMDALGQLGFTQLSITTRQRSDSQ